MTNTSQGIAETAQVAAEKFAAAVGTARNNDSVSAAIDKASAFYREHPVVSKVAVGLFVAGIATAVTRGARH